LSAGNSVLRSTHVGVSAWFGLLFGTIIKLVSSLMMVALFGAAWWWNRSPYPLREADSSSTIEMISKRTVPPTLSRQPSICWRSNSLPAVLPFATISILEPEILSDGPMSTPVTLPKRPCGTKRLFISCLILLIPVSNSSLDCLSSMGVPHY
jgi:hypothetical protein